MAAGALAIHVAAFALLDRARVAWRWRAGPAAAETRAAEALPLTIPGPVDVDVVALVDVDHLPPPMAVWGPGDLAGFSATHPLPNASVDRPGDRAAERGGGAAGGPTVWAARRDRLDDATLLAEAWNGGSDYRAAHDGDAARAASPEALHRQPSPSAGDRDVRALARDGGEVAARGAASGVGAADVDAMWRDADPRLGGAPGRDQAVRRSGATQVNRDPALTEAGTAAADVTRHAPQARDAEHVAAASDEREPDPYDLTPAQSGGTDRGVAGAAGAGALSDGRGRGEGATRANAARGDRDLAIKASKQDPYFRALITRIEREVVFPRDLAVDLRSGRATARFILAADGTISDIRLHASSGFQGFDDELLRAVRTLHDLGPAPARLLDGKSRLVVLIPFEFRNPLVR